MDPKFVAELIALRALVLHLVHFVSLTTAESSQDFRGHLERQVSTNLEAADIHAAKISDDQDRVATEEYVRRLAMGNIRDWFEILRKAH